MVYRERLWGELLDNGEGGWVHERWDPLYVHSRANQMGLFVSWMFRMPWGGPHTFLLSRTSPVTGLLLFPAACSPVTAERGLGWG